jgi:hypothetical protein
VKLAALGKEVKFVSLPTAGNEEFDEMVCTYSSSIDSAYLAVLIRPFFLQYEYLSTIGFYNTPVPNPDLVALGVTFGTLEEFAEREVKHRFA